MAVELPQHLVIADRGRIQGIRGFGCRRSARSLARPMLWCGFMSIVESLLGRLGYVKLGKFGLDEFMRATGSMMRLGHRPIWGPGRHGAGDNTFSYFQDPGTNYVMEYTTALQQIDDDHGWTPKVYTSSDEDTDQWGTSNPFDEMVMTSLHGRPDPGLWTPPPL